MLNVFEINKTRQFLDLRNEWNMVLDRSKDDNVFLTWEWLSTYWRHFGEDRKLRILCVEDKTGIIAIAPLRQSRRNIASPVSYKMTEPLSSRTVRLASPIGVNIIEPLGYQSADYTGLILAEREAECLALFINHLFESDDWDFLFLFDIPGTSAVPDTISKISEWIPKSESTEGAICPYLALPTSVETFLQELDGRFRKDLRRCMKNLKKDFRRVELKRYDEFGSVEEAMNIFFDLHQKRWKSKKMPGVFSSQKVRDFSLDAARQCAHNGWLALHVLTANDVPIAAQFCLEYKQKMYYGLGGFNPDFAKYSVGNLITAQVIEKCIQRRVKEYDFMRGDESYKYKWGAKYRRNLNIRIVNKGFTSRLCHLGTKTIRNLGIDRFLKKSFTF